ncbi:MAG: alpha/beta fold hydrolase [Candidatus Cloacimonetes bacterium]|nr:alpha/beta fold hydrolase [Candidatus Cloacimonadota bacterium]
MKLDVHTYGDAGPALVILHGLLGSGTNWGSFAREFAPVARIIAPDQRNHGTSPHDGDMSVEALAADLLETLDDLELERTHLLGHSMGGKVAMHFATRWPERVRHLLLADITAREYGEGEHRWIFDALGSLDPGTLVSLRDAGEALRPLIPDPGLRQFLLMTLERDPEGSGLRFRVNLPVLSRELQRIRGATPLEGVFEGPTLLVRGERSDYVADEDLPPLRSHFPRLQLATLAHAGHWLHVDQPVAFQRLCAGFFELGELPRG